jgi:hypothetical protein
MSHLVNSIEIILQFIFPILIILVYGIFYLYTHKFEIDKKYFNFISLVFLSIIIITLILELFKDSIGFYLFLSIFIIFVGILFPIYLNFFYENRNYINFYIVVLVMVLIVIDLIIYYFLYILEFDVEIIHLIRVGVLLLSICLIYTTVMSFLLRWNKIHSKKLYLKK